MRIWLFIAALTGGLGILTGAFAAHGLKAHLTPDALAVFDTGARYQMLHALAMGLAAFAIRGDAADLARRAALLFLTGILLFSGSLYALALTGVTGLGIVTPFGGLAFVTGWVLLALAALKLPQL